MSRIENHLSCPKCLYMEIDADTPNKGNANLYLTISFAEQTFNLFIGNVTIGIREAFLSLSLSNCVMPYANRGMVAELALDVVAVKKFTKSSEGVNQHENSASSSASGMSILDTIGVNAKTSKTDISKHQFEQEYKKILNLVTTSGPPDNPIWTFRAFEGDKQITGTLIDEFLGSIHISKPGANYEATVTVRPKDLVFTYTDGLLPDGLTKNKQAVIRLIILRAIKSYFYPNLAKTTTYI